MIISTGCSFTYGSGLINPKEDSYGAVLASKLNTKHVNLAVPAASNFHIALQIEYALRNYTNIDTILVGITSYARFSVLKDQFYERDLGDENLPLTLEPFLDGKYLSSTLKMKRTISQVVGSDRFKTLERYYSQFFIKKHQIAVDYRLVGYEILTAKSKNIRVRIISDQFFAKNHFSEDLINFNFFETSNIMPDTLGTSHMNEEAHRILADKIFISL